MDLYVAMYKQSDFCKRVVFDNFLFGSKSGVKKETRVILRGDRTVIASYT